ncbi:MAG: prephenate dehydratase [Chthoniobacterales bacterium]
MNKAISLVYQGSPGSFSHATALRHCGEHHIFQGKKTFAEVFETLEKGEATYGIVPIENSLIGSIYENYDLLGKSNLSIVKEMKTRVELALIALPDVDIDQITTVFSHTKALEQCRRFFKKYFHLQATVHTDTGGAVAEVKKRNDSSLGAIASTFAAQLYGLTVIQEHLEDDLENYTRFVLLSRKNISKISDIEFKKNHKCSVSFYLEHKEGALASVLELLAMQGVNLTKIESRPIQGRAFEYLFYIDFQMPLDQERQEEMTVIEALQRCVKNLNVLGIYECY